MVRSKTSSRTPSLHFAAKIDRLKSHIASTKNLLSSPKLLKQDPTLFYQAREQLSLQEGLLKQAQGGGL